MQKSFFVEKRKVELQMNECSSRDVVYLPKGSSTVKESSLCVNIGPLKLGIDGSVQLTSDMVMWRVHEHSSGRLVRSGNEEWKDLGMILRAISVDRWE